MSTQDDHHSPRLFRRRRRTADFRAEIQAHLDHEADERRAEGLSPVDAQTAATKAFGNVALVQERFYEAARWMWWERVCADVRYGVRSLARTPGFTSIAVLTLALGIGANTAIFTVIQAGLLQTLPVPQPQRLVLLTDPNVHGHMYGGEGPGSRSLLTYAEFAYLRDHNSVFSGMFAADSSLPEVPIAIGTADPGLGVRSDQAHVRLVSGSYFTTLGVSAWRGRVFTAAVDHVPGATPIAVVSHAFWKSHLNSDASAIGATIDIRRTPFTIVGIAPPDFAGETVGDAPDLWVPLTMQTAVLPGVDMLSPAGPMDNAHIWLQTMARLERGVTPSQAQEQVSVLFHQMLQARAGSEMTAKQRDSYLAQRIDVRPGARGVSTIRSAMADPLTTLMVLVGLVLLIACANVATLLLARGSARQRELTIRAAMGAARSRIMGQLLIESALLAGAGALLGLAFAPSVSTLLLRLMPAGVDTALVHLNLTLNLPVLLFALAATVLTVLLFGVVPAWRATRLDLTEMLRSRVTSQAAPGHASTSRSFVIAEVVAAMILLVAAAMFARSLHQLSAVQLGYSAEHLMLVRVDTSAAGYQGDQLFSFYRQMQERLATIPGVTAASFSANGLFDGHESGDPIAVEGYEPSAGDTPHARLDHVGPGYFRTVGMPIEAGREFTSQDAAPGLRMGVVNETFTRTFFGRTNPLGKTIRDVFPGNPGSVQVVGVVGDGRVNDLRETIQPRVYVPALNPLWPQRRMIFELRTADASAALASSVRTAVDSLNRDLLPVQIHDLPALVDRSLGTDRFVARLAGTFALLAALLAGIGLYGMMAYTVAQRTPDIGIRMALGATRSDVLWSVLRSTLRLVAVGMALGLPITLIATRFIRSLLFGVGDADAISILAAVVMLSFVAVLASLVPARRAARIDPISAIRFE
jgi:predicted permease